jgi:Cdc6-like AAA superfamily ATPase
MKRKEYDIVKLARAKYWLEQQIDVDDNFFTYNNLSLFGMLDDLLSKYIDLSQAYIEDTNRLVDDMLSRFTTIALTYDDNSTFSKVNDVVRRWTHFHILEVNKAERKLVLEGEKEVLDQVKAELETMVQGWNENSLAETRRLAN